MVRSDLVTEKGEVKAAELCQSHPRVLRAGVSTDTVQARAGLGNWADPASA